MDIMVIINHENDEAVELKIIQNGEHASSVLVCTVMFEGILHSHKRLQFIC